MRIKEIGDCQICQEPDTGRHIIFKCKKYENNRNEISFEKLKEKWKDKAGTEIKKIWKFMKDNEIEI